jgi:excisionase family DNA binding protein
MSDRLAAALSELVDAIRAEVSPPTTPLGPDPLLDIPAACAAMGGIGRSALYGLLSSGDLRSVKVGRRRLIPSAAIREYVERAA